MASAASVLAPRFLEIVSARRLLRDCLFVSAAPAGWIEAAPGQTPQAVVVDALLGCDVVRDWAVRRIPVAAVAAPGSRPAVPELLEAGARAVVLETTPIAELLLALDRILSGERYLATDVSEQGEWRADPLAGLSNREREVFTYLVEGKRTKDIANCLVLSPKTVDSYRATMMSKLGIHDVAGLVRYAVRHRLIDEV
ncbi:MAG: response regulator transcription factor [Bryobacterales bacterium]|nr:response regulator transcription factor [Bryobacterales bacterium]